MSSWQTKDVGSETTLANARLVLADEVVLGSLHLAGGMIVAIDTGAGIPKGAIDLDGDHSYSRRLPFRQCVTRRPARAAGLGTNLGEIKDDYRADLVRVKIVDDRPMLRAVWRGGIQLF